MTAITVWLHRVVLRHRQDRIERGVWCLCRRPSILSPAWIRGWRGYGWHWFGRSNQGDA